MGTRQRKSLPHPKEKKEIGQRYFSAVLTRHTHCTFYMHVPVPVLAKFSSVFLNARLSPVAFGNYLEVSVVILLQYGPYDSIQ